MKFKLGSKGIAVGDMANIAQLFVVTMVMITIAVWVMGAFSESSFTAAAVVNDTITLSNGTYVPLNNHYVDDVSSIQNVSHMLLVGNYTCTRMDPVADSCNMTLITNDAESWGTSAGTWNVSYTIFNSTAFLASMNATKGIGNLASWSPVFGVILAAALVIGILMTGMSLKGRGSV